MIDRDPPCTTANKPLLDIDSLYIIQVLRLHLLENNFEGIERMQFPAKVLTGCLVHGNDIVDSSFYHLLFTGTEHLA